MGDEEVARVPRILTPLTAVRAALMYLRTNTSQEAIADVAGASQRPAVTPDSDGGRLSASLGCSSWARVSLAAFWLPP